MVDDDSDVDYSDIDSPLSYSVHGGGQQSTSSHLSTDRLYSAPSRYLFVPDHETPLLAHRDAWGQYQSTSSNHSEANPKPLGMLTRKISRVFQSKAYDYDNNKSSLAAVGSGERVW